MKYTSGKNSLHSNLHRNVSFLTKLISFQEGFQWIWSFAFRHCCRFGTRWKKNWNWNQILTLWTKFVRFPISSLVSVEVFLLAFKQFNHSVVFIFWSLFTSQYLGSLLPHCCRRLFPDTKFLNNFHSRFSKNLFLFLSHMTKLHNATCSSFDACHFILSDALKLFEQFILFNNSCRSLIWSKRCNQHNSKSYSTLKYNRCKTINTLRSLSRLS